MHVMCVAVAGLDITPNWVRFVAVLSVYEGSPYESVISMQQEVKQCIAAWAKTKLPANDRATKVRPLLV
jgi:hypothetical protein